jgi:hypothetical protein
VGVEVLEHPAPDAVDGAVGLVDDDEVEGLWRQVLGVGDGDGRVGDVVVEARVVALGDVVAAQHRVDALDRGDDDVRGAEHAGAGELVDVVDLGEAAPVAGGAVVLELADRLFGEVVAVDEEQDATEAAELQQAVGEGDSGEGLAGAGGHLDQGSVEVLVGEALLHTRDRGDLGRTQRRGVELREVADLGSPRRMVGIGLGVADDLGESLRLGEVEDAPGPRVGVVAVREVGLRPAGLKDERQPSLDGHRSQLGLCREPGGVHRRLPLDA